jgi:hypothetical protein
MKQEVGALRARCASMLSCIGKDRILLVRAFDNSGQNLDKFGCEFSLRVA